MPHTTPEFLPCSKCNHIYEWLFYDRCPKCNHHADFTIYAYHERMRAIDIEHDNNRLAYEEDEIEVETNYHVRTIRPIVFKGLGVRPQLEEHIEP